GPAAAEHPHQDAGAAWMAIARAAGAARFDDQSGRRAAAPRIPARAGTCPAPRHTDQLVRQRRADPALVQSTRVVRSPDHARRHGTGLRCEGPRIAGPARARALRTYIARRARRVSRASRGPRDGRGWKPRAIEG